MPVRYIRHLLLFVLLLWMSSCMKQSAYLQELTVFRYNEANNITSLDPVYARNQANIWATSQIYNGLVQLDESLKVSPSIALNWEVAGDGLLYRFTLRTDVRFHDSPCFPDGLGRTVTAHDFEYSLRRITDPRLNSPGSWVLQAVARLNDGNPDIRALNDSILEIRLSRPFPPFLGLLAMQYCSVVPVEAIEYYGQDFRRNPVGTGPFRFAWWKEGVKLVMLKNPGYFEWHEGERLPRLDAVSIRFITDRQTAFLEFIRGNLDFLSGIDASYKDELLTPLGELQERHKDRFYKISMPFLNTEYLGFQLDSQHQSDENPLLNRRVRQAINYGFDREKMLAFLRNNMGTPAYGGFVPTGMPGFEETGKGYHYNPSRARELLAEAGYPGGVGLPVINLQTNAMYADIAQFLQFELSRIGIRISVDVLPPATLREAMARGESPFFRASWIADYPDAENFLALFYSPNRAPAGPNYTRFSSSAFDKLYEAALLARDDTTRLALYREMDLMIQEEAPVVFLFYDQSVRVVPHYVKGLHNNPLNHLVLKYVSIEK